MSDKTAIEEAGYWLSLELQKKAGDELIKHLQEPIEEARKIFTDIWCDSEMYESDFYYMAEAWLKKYGDIK